MEPWGRCEVGLQPGASHQAAHGPNDAEEPNLIAAADHYRAVALLPPHGVSVGRAGRQVGQVLLQPLAVEHVGVVLQDTQYLVAVKVECEGVLVAEVGNHLALLSGHVLVLERAKDGRHRRIGHEERYIVAHRVNHGPHTGQVVRHLIGQVDE